MSSFSQKQWTFPLEWFEQFMQRNSSISNWEVEENDISNNKISISEQHFSSIALNGKSRKYSAHNSPSNNIVNNLFIAIPLISHKISLSSFTNANLSANIQQPWKHEPFILTCKPPFFLLNYTNNPHKSIGFCSVERRKKNKEEEEEEKKRHNELYKMKKKNPNAVTQSVNVSYLLYFALKIIISVVDGYKTGTRSEAERQASYQNAVSPNNNHNKITYKSHKRKQEKELYAASLICVCVCAQNPIPSSKLQVLKKKYNCLKNIKVSKNTKENGLLKTKETETKSARIDVKMVGEVWRDQASRTVCRDPNFSMLLQKWKEKKRAAEPNWWWWLTTTAATTAAAANRIWGGGVRVWALRPPVLLLFMNAEQEIWRALVFEKYWWFCSC